MDFLDRLSIAPADSTLVQSQSVLFAAALFIGCTLFDAQSANHQFDELVGTVTTAVKHTMSATAAQEAPAAAKAAAPRLWTPLRVSALPQWLARPVLRSGPACYKPELAPAPQLAARKSALPAASMLALLD